MGAELGPVQGEDEARLKQLRPPRFHEAEGLPEKHLAPLAPPAGIGVGEEEADVPKAVGGKEGVGEGVEGGVPIGWARAPTGLGMRRPQR